MATNQYTPTQLAVSIPLAPGHSQSTAAAAAQYPAQEQQEAPAPVPPIFVVAGSTPVSTPTSGMHSPPLSGTLEEEANEKQAAHDAAAIGRSQRSDPGKTATPTLPFTTPPPTSRAPAPTTTGSSKRTGATVLSGSSRTGGTQGRGSPSVTAPTTMPKTTKAKPDGKFAQPKNLSDMEMHTPSDRTRDSNSSAHSFGPRTATDFQPLRPDLHQVRRPQSKEMTIEHVLQQGKILKVSRRLRTRLEYAILKIRRGWTKYTLQEVESLIQPVCSPRITPRQIQQSISLQSSPLLTERRRVNRTTHQRRLSDPARIEQYIDSDIDMQQAPPNRFRSRMPSLSQFKDSELFLPAKSLMEIAASKPEPGYLSPYLGAQSSPYMQQSSAHNSPHSSRYGTPEPLYRDMTPVRDTSSRTNWSGYSSPARDEPMEEDEQDENGAPSEAQVAQTILMLSSPTRPAPRTLNQNYITEMHSGSPTHSPLGEWTAPYSPMTSSPLVQFQTMDSASPSPDRTPTMSTPSTLSHTDKERGTSPSSSSASSSHQRGSSYSSIRQSKQTRSSSPTLKRAVKFAAAATQGSLDSSSGLSVERIKDKISGLSRRGEYNSTADMIYPGSQPGHDDKKEYSPAPSYASPAYGDGFAHHQHQRDITPPPQQHHQSTSSSSSALSAPGLPYNNSGGSHHSGHHGMRTPPLSGGKDMDVSQYSSLGAQGSGTTMRMRRDSGMAQTGKTDDLTTLLRRGAPSSSASSTSSSSRPGPSMHRS
ncbi:hypothetical protein BGW39_010239 [Mortierella sp. 14UC]|nr:hypothetical protein BGW39_010239 [Mortierella sp. 14UC]